MIKDDVRADFRKLRKETTDFVQYAVQKRVAKEKAEGKVEFTREEIFYYRDEALKELTKHWQAQADAIAPPRKPSFFDEIDDLLYEIVEVNCDADTPQAQEINDIIDKIKEKLQNELPENMK